MAQGGRKQSSQVPGMLSGGPKGGGAAGSGRPGGGKPVGKPKGGARQSVAAARRSKGDRTQLIIGGVAIVVIIAIIAIGLVMYQKSTATQGDGYGSSKLSTATVGDSGAITVSNGSPALQLDIYEDALCPICGEFEAQFGQQIAQAIDAGQLTVNYHMVDFLNPSSASKSYSTRAYAALLAVAKNDGSKPGVLMQYHSALFSSKNQPKEQGKTDLSNEQLAALAGTVGASEAAQQEISAGSGVAAASADAQTNLTKLTAVAATVGGQAGTPTVARDGKPVAINDPNWLTNLLPKAAGSSGAVTGTTAASASK